MSFPLVNYGSGSFHVYQICVLGGEIKLQETIYNFPCARQVSQVQFTFSAVLCLLHKTPGHSLLHM